MTSSIRTAQGGRSGGFTLVELLVVLGLIGVLIALLLPVLSAARRSGRDVACLSNLRQIGGLAAAWAGEHGGYLPLDGEAALPAGTGRGDLANALADSRRNRYDYTDTPFGVSNVPTREMPTPFHVALAVRALAVDSVADLGPPSQWASEIEPRHGGLSLFHCPAAPTHPRAEATPQGTSSFYVGVGDTFYDFPWWTTFGYATNGGLLGFHHDRDLARRRYAGRLSAAGEAARLVVNGDAEGAGSRWTPSLDLAGGRVSMRDVWLATAAVGDTAADFTQSDLDPDRHAGRVNLAYLDGHAAPIAAEGDGRALADALLLSD